MSTLRVTTLATQAGVEVYTAKAWVNFNGTGTVAIRGSGNVSSITDRGVGQYTVNFTTAMPDANYACSGYGNTLNVATSYNDFGWGIYTKSASSFLFDTFLFGSGYVDSAICDISVFR
jgi:hypothetical protein